MTQSRLVLVGAGGHALVVAETAQGAGFLIVGFYDDEPQAALARRLSIPCLGPLAGAASANDGLIVALGDLGLRAAAIARMGSASGRAVSVVSVAAFVSSSASVGPGVFIGPHATVHSFASVGAHAIINTGAIVEHECEIAENVHVAPGAVLGGNVRVGRQTLVGLGARVLPGVRIGTRCIVGAGAVVLRDVPDGSTVAGVPATSRDSP